MHRLEQTNAVIFMQVLISRNYRGDLEMSVIEKFFPLVLDREDEGNSSPIIIHESATFTYIKHHNLYGRCIVLVFASSHSHIP